MGTKTNPKTEPETGPLKKLRSSERKIPCSKKGTKMVPQKGVPCETLASFMFGLLFFARFWGLPSLLWTIICPHFRALGLDFLVFSRLRFQDFGANETHPIHTHKPTIFIFHKGCPLRAGGDARSVRNFNLFYRFLTEIRFRTIMKLPQEASFGTKMCKGKYMEHIERYIWNMEYMAKKRNI